LLSISLLLTQLPTVRMAALFPPAFTMAVALATFLTKRHDQNPLLARTALLVGVALLTYVVRPEHLVAWRWKWTLAQGGPADRAEAAARLVQRGFLDLRGARLAGQKLAEIHLADADLRGADLAGADLREAALTEVKLDGARLRGANLSGADLYGSTAAGADGFEAARCDEATVMPENWSCVAQRPSPDLGQGRSAPRKHGDAPETR
jgi:uncharacterized protein YjbI with pentapeptide repeats